MKTTKQQMNYTLETLNMDISALSPYRYTNIHIINDFEICEDPHPEATNMTKPLDGKFKKGSYGEIWSGFDRYRWVKFFVDVPKATDFNDKDGKYLLYVDAGLHVQGYTGSFEGTLFIDGKPYSGVDGNHMEVFLDKKFAGKRIEVYIRFWSGMSFDNGPCKMTRQFTEFSLRKLDTKTDDLYYSAKCLLEAVEFLPETSSEALSYVKALSDSMGEIDWAYSQKENKALFYESIYRAHDILDKTYREFNKNEQVTVHVFGQTHIDVAWLWRIKNTKEKAARSFATVLRNMELFPEYTFFQSQPQLYSFVKKDFPEEYREIKARVKEGRWNADGAMWLEPDCNLPCGESLVRQLLYGKRFLKEEFGVDAKVVWLPDTFGFNAALPQILKKAGIDAFVTSKMCWSDYNRMPHDTFNWKGIDGSKILTCFVTTPVLKNYDTFGTTCNGILTAKTIYGAWNHYRDKELSRDVFLCYGFGDGGGGPTRDMIENKRRIAKIPGLPNVKDDGLTAYCKLMKNNLENKDDVPEWDGELYLENHRGTFTSQAFVKRANRKLEFLLRRIETAEIALYLQTGVFNVNVTKKIHELYMSALLCQFHDILPGSAVGSVYKDAAITYEKTFDEAKKLLFSLEKQQSKKSGAAFSICNPISQNGDFLVEYKTKETSLGFESNGKKLNSQKTVDGYLIEIKDLPPLSYTAVFARKGEAKEDKILKYNKNVYETPLYRFSFDKSGRMISLFDKKQNRSVIKAGGLGNYLCSYDDRPLCYDAWNIDVSYKKKAYPVDDLVSLKVEENGSLRAKLKLKWHHIDSSIEQDIIFYRNSPRIDFETTVDWKERHQLLRTSFDVDILSDTAVFDIPFGNIKRPTHSNTSWDFAKFEVCAQKWEDLSEGDYGVALMNDCKYGCSVKENTLSLSLLKSACSPDPKADEGKHKFTYSLLPHKGNFKDADIEKAAYILNNPATVIKNGNVCGSIFSVPSGVEIDAVKKCENDDSVIVRLHEYLGCRRKIELKSSFEIKSFCETDLLEKEISKMSEQNSISIELKPYEIKTLKVLFNN